MSICPLFSLIASMQWPSGIAHARFRTVLLWLSTCGAAIILIAQLFLPPPVGLANNGDFGKVIGPFGFGADIQDEFKFAPVEYTFGHKFYMGYRSSEHLLTAAALGVNRIIEHRDGKFDLRSIGFVHGALVLLAFVLYSRRGLVFTLGALLIFGDALYVTALNSFYMDTSAYVFLLLAAAFYMFGQGWWLLAASLLLVTSKAPHAVLGLPIFGLILCERGRLGLASWKAPLAAGLLLAGTLWGWNASPTEYYSNGVFSVIFFRLLPGSPEVSDDLHLLGLDDSYRPYVGQHAYSANTPFDQPGFRTEFKRRTSYWRIGRFYLEHPKRALSNLSRSLAAAGRQRPTNLGNFDRQYGRPEFAQSRSFALWSNFKTRIFEGNGEIYLGAIILLTIVALTLVVDDPASRPGMITLVAVTYLELLISALGDPLEIRRHFFLFHALEDLLFLGTVTLVARRVEKVFGRRVNMLRHPGAHA